VLRIHEAHFHDNMRLAAANMNITGANMRTPRRRQKCLSA
jgi:hypothetical protein